MVKSKDERKPLCKNVFVTGLGGQGVLTVSKVLGKAAMDLGHSVTIFNAKGMAQRGGRVTSEVRIVKAGENPEHRARIQAYGSRIPEEGADILIGLEIGESLNSLSFLKASGTAVLLDHAIVPTTAILKKETYPEISEVATSFNEKTGSVYVASNTKKPHNMYILGFFASILDAAPRMLFGVDSGSLEAAMKSAVRNNQELNCNVFRLGMKMGGEAEPRV